MAFASARPVVHDARVREALARLPPWAHALIALSGSVMLGLGAPPQGLTLLIWLSFVPLMLVMRVAQPGRIRRPLWLGLVGGLGVGLIGFPWVAELLGRFAMAPAWVAALGQLAFSMWTAVPFALWALLVVNGPRRGAASVAWPVVVYVAIAAMWPDLFPYTAMIGLAETPEWIQLAELGGVPLVEAQVVLAGVLLADAILGGPGGDWPTRRRAIAGGVAISAPCPLAAINPRRAAPNAPPKSPATGSSTGRSSAVAMAFSQYSERVPPPTPINRSNRVPVEASASRLSRIAKLTPSSTARTSARRSVSCPMCRKDARTCASLCGVRSPPR